MISSAVKWRGQQAEYSTDERQIMQQLTVREQAFVHTLKALTDGEIGEPLLTGSGLREVAAASPSGRHTPSPGQEGFALVGSIPAAGINRPAFTDPEELEFGPPKRRPKLYALAWTWRKHKIVKFKKHGERQLRVWKRWYERQGWKVISLAGGYMAAKDGERHSIALHEYDRETLERLR